MNIKIRFVRLVIGTFNVLPKFLMDSAIFGKVYYGNILPINQRISNSGKDYLDILTRRTTLSSLFF